MIANEFPYAPGRACFRGTLRPGGRGEGFDESWGSVDHGFEEAHLADLPATKIVEAEGDASSREGQECRAILPGLEGDRFSRESIGEVKVKLADFDSGSRECPFQRPFRESRQVSGRVVDRGN